VVVVVVVVVVVDLVVVLYFHIWLRSFSQYLAPVVTHALEPHIG